MTELLILAVVFLIGVLLGFGAGLEVKTTATLWQLTPEERQYNARVAELAKCAGIVLNPHCDCIHNEGNVPVVINGQKVPTHCHTAKERSRVKFARDVKAEIAKGYKKNPGPVLQSLPVPGQEKY